MLVIYLDNPNLRNCLLFGLSTAVMIDIRNVGVILPILAVILMIIRCIYDRKRITPDANRKQILESNIMPLRMEVYSEDNYEEFISMRADLVGQFVDSLVI